MRYPAQDTAERHDRLLRAASTMFRERGFDDVTVAEVMKAAGLTHGSFYSHYDSKEDLMIAATDYAMQRTLGTLKKNLASDGGRQAYVKQYLSEKHRDNPGAGCAMAALSGEVRRKPQVKEIFTAKLKEIIAALGPEREKSILTVAALVGAMTLARGVSDEGFSEEILEAVAKHFIKPADQKVKTTTPKRASRQ